MRVRGWLASVVLVVAAMLVLVPGASAQERTNVDAEAVPGEFVVAFTSSMDSDSAATRSRTMAAGSSRASPPSGSTRVEFPQTKERRSKAADKAKQNELKADKRFKFAEPNFIYQAAFTPNDPR